MILDRTDPPLDGSAIRDRRAQRSADDTLVGSDLCRTWTGDVDEWLGELFAAAVAQLPDAVGAGERTGEGEGKRPGGASLALVALGGYGRGEMSLHSDIDVTLLHHELPGEVVRAVADAIWYPIWDAGVKLGHAVRTVDEALALAADDLDTATSLLDARFVAGDRELAARLTTRAELLWHKRARRFLSRMDERVRERHAAQGEVAYLLEPELKEGRGGLRDVQCLRWAQATRSLLWEDDHHRLVSAYDLLLAVRVELHRRTGRPTDTLVLEQQDAVAAALGYADADQLMRDLSAAARTVAWTSDDAWARIQSSMAGPLSRLRRERNLGSGILLRDKEIHIGAAAEPATDPALALRAAAHAAQNETRLARSSLNALAEVEPPLPEPWPDAVRSALVDLLLAGPPAVPVLEALDQAGIWERYFPEWPSVRAKPQRNAYHRYTVDRHLWEAGTQAARLAGYVRRPDLLVVGALLHDIGKGQPGDHTEVGMQMLEEIGPRLGYDTVDAAVLVDMCRHHLLLPDVATRRDLDEPAVIQGVAAAVRDAGTLELLAALTEADSLATGPAAWSAWKAELVKDLVGRVDRHLSGGAAGRVPDDDGVTDENRRIPTPQHRELMTAGRQVIEADGDRLTVVCPDRHGLFNKVVGVLTLRGLQVLDAAAVTEDGMALEVFRVESSLGPSFSWEPVLEDLDRALAGQLALRARLAEHARRYQRKRVDGAHDLETEVIFDQDSGGGAATVVEVHARNSVGLLYRITRALADLDVEIVSAKVQTLGPKAVDSFYVQDVTGRKLVPEVLPELERAILHET